jgi:hypothetical protein
MMSMRWACFATACAGFFLVASPAFSENVGLPNVVVVLVLTSDHGYWYGEHGLSV